MHDGLVGDFGRRPRIVTAARFAADLMSDDSDGLDLYMQRGRRPATSDLDGPYTTETKSIETLDNDLFMWGLRVP